MTSFDLSYDYRCPFAKNIHLHVLAALRAGAEFDVTFIPWTMSQGYVAEGNPDSWDDPAFDADHLSLYVSADVASRRPHEVMAQSFAQFDKYEAFGVPTFVVDGDATFVRYMTTPSNDPQASVKIIESILSLIAKDPDLNEFKHTRVPY